MNKKITDLQLIAAVTADLSVPGDDGIQTYRFTTSQLKTFILANGNILLAMLAADIFNGLATVSAADDDYFPLIDTSDSNNTKKALVGTFVRAVYRSVSSYPATVASTDVTMKLSGTSGTITLPTAVGLDGKRFKFIHAGTSLTNVYTIGTTSSQTIGGIAGGSYALYTAGEVLEVESDGANWIIMGRYARTAPASWTPTFAGFGTPTGVNCYWWRDGKHIFGAVGFVGGTVSGTTASVSFPSNVTSDATVIGNFGGGFGHVIPIGSGEAHAAMRSALVGANKTAFNFSASDGSNVNLTAVTGSGLMGSTQSCTFLFNFPVKDWQP